MTDQQVLERMQEMCEQSCSPDQLKDWENLKEYLHSTRKISKRMPGLIEGRKEQTMSEDEYRCVEPFYIDNGELDGLTLQQAFVLGVEWRQVYDHVERNEPLVDQPVHTRNLARLEMMLDHKGVHFDLVEADEEWTYLTTRPV